MIARHSSSVARSVTRSVAAAVAAFALLVVVGPALAAPEIVVRIDGSVVPNSSEYIFDDTVVGESDQFIVVLRNDGDEDLVFSESPPVLLSGGFPDQFSLIQPALETGAKLSPNGSTAFSVTFSPNLRFSNLFSHVYVWTNDGPSPFHIMIRGKSLAPVLSVTLDGSPVAGGSSVEFGSVDVGETEQKTFVLRNTGDAPLHFTGEPLVAITGAAAGEFVVIPPALEDGDLISPDGSTAFAVRYEPTGTQGGALAAEVHVATDDLGGEFVISLGAQAVGVQHETIGKIKGQYQE